MYIDHDANTERVGILVRAYGDGATAEIVHRTGTYQAWDDITVNAHDYPILATVAVRDPETGEVQGNGDAAEIFSDDLVQKAYEAIGAPELGPLSDETPSRPALAEYVDEAEDEAA